MIFAVFFFFFFFFSLPPSVAAPAETLSFDQLTQYLPENFASEAKSALSEAFTSASTGITFVSGQSYTSLGGHVINRVQFLQGRKTDVWIMRQKAEEYSSRGHGWDTLTLLVDKTTSPKTAYFVQWEKNPEEQTSLHPGALTAMCFTCHANGPRALRPLKLPRLAKLNKEQWNTVYEWNGIITDYGEIQTYKPWVTSLNHPLALPGRIDNEPLENHTCTSCHWTGSGVRSPLLRQHGPSILAMIENTADSDGYYISALHQNEAFMPLSEHKLKAQDLACLKDWIENRSMAQPRPGCNSRGETSIDAKISTLQD